MLEKREEINEHMTNLLESLHTAVSRASDSSSDALKKEAVYLAGQCAEVLDSWICHSLGGE